MGADTVPVKTPEGQAELRTRRLHLSQRHRTVLLLVDGRRTEAEVRSLAAQAGVAETCFDELLGLSLIALPELAPIVASAVIAAVAPSVTAAARLPVVPPGPIEGQPSAPIPLVVMQDSLLPASETLPPDSSALDSVLSGPPPPDSWLPCETGEDPPEAVDMAFERAREILLRVVRAEAPVAGSLTLLRLRRARTRDDLSQLLDEVEARINKRHRTLSASQTLASVRQLLAPLPDSTRSAA